jgi:protein TonB
MGSMALMDTGTAAGDRRLWLAIGVSLLLHATLLSLHFTFPEASRAMRNKALDIILVNARSERRPTEAQALAQVNLDGGGNSEEDRIATTPLPASPREQAGNELEQAQARARALEEQQRKLLTQAHKSTRALPPEEARPSPEPAPPPPEAPVSSGRDMANRALEMSRMQAQIARQIDDYNQWPRGKYSLTRAEEFAGAAYLDGWARKIEKIGTLNFPAQAKGKIYGKVIIWIELWRNGDLKLVEIRQTSGARVLDDAALRIVRMGAPYGEMPRAMIGDGDYYGFARTLLFTNENQLHTK